MDPEGNHSDKTIQVPEADTDVHFMGEALCQAQRAWKQGEVPVGAVIVRSGIVIARAHNQVETLKDATAHAEMLAITQAESVVGNWRLTECDLYVTKEPCLMCAGAMVLVRLRRVVFGCPDARSGGAGGRINILQMTGLNHRCLVVSGVQGAKCGILLKNFFASCRAPIFEYSQSTIK